MPSKPDKVDKEAMKRDIIAGDNNIDIARKFEVSLSTVYQLRSKMKKAGELSENEE
jgi:transposase